MKVVLFCGGLGLRMRDVSARLPKPMVSLGDSPILVHVMKYYAFHGHTDFILCLGYKGRVVRDYFRSAADPFLRNFTLCDAGRAGVRRRAPSQDWRVTFAETGLHANIGQRLRAVRALVEPDDLFLANYADVLTDAPLPDQIARVEASGATASFLCVRPSYTFHVVSSGADGLVRDIRHVSRADVWINGGYFVFRRAIFDAIGEGEELVEAPFERLVAAGRLLAHRHEGFWAPMDTFKDRQTLMALVAADRLPWPGWTPGSGAAAPESAA